MLRVENLTLHYGHSRILHGVDLSADTGQVTCLMGTNGVGKTSLIRAIAGRHPRSGGTITLDGEALPVLPAHQLARKGIALVSQGREVFPLLTVRENLETGFSCLPKSDHAVPEEMFDLFPVLKAMQHRRGGDLSGGQQQQLAIARALITRPRLLLMDEPTEGIQPNIIQMIGEVIRKLRNEGRMAIVLVEQYFDFAYDLADRFTVLRRGAVTMAGTKAEVSREALLQAVTV
ncbi:urea ABC transporter ATP-binding subunit UrtE [Mesobacterium sp. TK19101]|uniref:Urea ABC transporter ATP-binding subunit UrtE n=1 Tax=Mesobacterium hydrothermale TaxID=3111907 RepID=A0ABU6HH34_9RHOB|nr:urea ABC transporter ATP-binding subunit UrtE [Mesobacterium sp. TK19101]MEC3861763.1 urea ABC transporter ATP-binding subunit UrtE [Mesobacterium sp. TK19101]